MLITFAAIASLAVATPQTDAAVEPQTVQASEALASEALTRRADDVVRVINGEGDIPAIFAESFLSRAPEAQLSRIAGAVRERHGRAVAVEVIEVHSAHEGVIQITFERAQMSALLQVEPNDGALIEGLLFQPPGRTPSDR